MDAQPFYLTDVRSRHVVGPQRRLYACKANGIWLTSTTVVIAADKGHAKRLAEKALAEAGVRKPSVWDIEEVTLDGAHVLDNGDY